MQLLSLTSPNLILYGIIAAVAIFLAWRTAASIFQSKSSDPQHLRKKLFIPLLIIIVLIALFQLMGIFFKE